jgi:hypothetical protein
LNTLLLLVVVGVVAILAVVGAQAVSVLAQDSL